jgi:hypothetical protein
MIGRYPERQWRRSASNLVAGKKIVVSTSDEVVVNAVPPTRSDRRV